MTGVPIQDTARRGGKRGHNKRSLWITVVPLMFLGCATPPYPSGGVGPLVSEEEELSMRAVLNEKARLFRLVQEQRLLAVGARLLAQLEDPPALTFKVTDGEEVNAYISNGSVKITLAMMRFLRNDDELAVILGHELGHLVWERSGTSLGGGSLKDMEREADLQGLIYVFKAGYDVRAAAELWARMGVELSGPQAKPWRSHPTLAERFIVARKVAHHLLTISPRMTVEELRTHLFRQLREKTDSAPLSQITSTGCC